MSKVAQVESTENTIGVEEKKKPKKRGRKPKGGKVVNIDHKIKLIKSPENVILHLKCSKEDLKKKCFLSDMKYNPVVENVTAFNHEMINENFLSLELNDTHEHLTNDLDTILNNECIEKTTTSTDNVTKEMIWKKIKQLKDHLKTDTLSSYKSDCFWCHYGFSSPTIYIPRSKVNGVYEVYGYFCSPECALAYLNNEHIDSSTKWERISLLHSLYSSVFEYNENIKPAPDPKYLLEKYVGNMTIEEYREMNHSKINLMILDKPITRIIPEVSEYADDIDIHSRFENKTEVSTKKYRLSRSLNTKETVHNVYPQHHSSIFTNKQYWKDIKQ
jgi:hypothetical protein